MVSPKKRQSNNAWDAKNMTIMACKVRKDYADEVRKETARRGDTVNAVIKKALDEYLAGQKERGSG